MLSYRLASQVLRLASFRLTSKPPIRRIMSGYLSKNFNEFLEQIKADKAEQVLTGIENYPYDERRSRCINGLKAKPTGNYRGVSFWMFRDQRIDDNWAMVCAQKFALQHSCPLYVTFFLMSHYSVAGTRQYDFMLKGLQQVEKQCKNLGIQFHLRLGYAKDLIDDYCEEHEIDLVIADFCPLRDPSDWVEEAGHRLKEKNIPLYQVDAHNIIPVWITSNKEEFGARTIRPKVHNFLNEFLTEIPSIEKHPYQPKTISEPTDWDRAWAHLKVDESVKPVNLFKPGTLNGYRMLHEFVIKRLSRYEDDRNFPSRDGCSELSPWFHFGQLSVQRAILTVSNKIVMSKCGRKSCDHFVEEAVVRRELADNFCFYNRNYDNYEGAANWAKKTHEEHRNDKREYIYSQKELQFGKTHDKLWNACQIQMVLEGKMHGYMRMYWAKKILEWTPSVEEAIRIACFLNDKYEFDGRDPNGYTGIMWSMVGIHDRAWTERPVFGKIRFMNYNGMKRKWDIDSYMRKYRELK